MADIPLKRAMGRPRLLGWGLGLAFAATATSPGWSQTTPALEPPPTEAHGVTLESFPHVSAYDLGPATLSQAGVESAWQTMPYRLQGILAIPPGEGPFPVVVVLHGRHSGCHFADEPTPSQWPCPAGTETRFDQGFAYLAQALAEAGYLVLVPNLNAAYANAYGATSANRTDLAEARNRHIINTHLQTLAEAHQGVSVGFPGALKEKLDLYRLAFIGHSMGGGAAVLNVRQRQQTGPDIPEAGFGPVKAMVLVSPTPSRSIQTDPAAYQVPDIPTGIVAGGCDRDVYDLSSLHYFETAYRDRQRQTTVVSALVPGANHNFFNAAVDQDDYYRRPDNDPLCSPQQSTLRLSRVDQETLLVNYALDFLAQTLHHSEADAGGDQSQVLFHRYGSGTLFDVPVLGNVAVPQAYRIPVLDLPLTAAVPPLPDVSGGVSIEVCPPFSPCPDARPRHPESVPTLSVQSSPSGGRLTFPIASTVDLRTFRSLQLRLAAIPQENAAQALAGFAVVLRDRAGQAARVEVPGNTPALKQFPSASPAHGLAYPSLVTIPLLQFRGVNLNQLATVEWVFDSGTEARLYLAGMAFVR